VPSDILIMLLCLRTLIVLYVERDVVVRVAVDKVGGIEDRLLSGVESDDAVSSPMKSVKVDMVLEERTTEGAELSKMLERRLRSVNSVKVDNDGVAERSPLKSVESLLKSDNAEDDNSDSGPWKLLFLEGFVGVDCVLDIDGV
jgi:hypothetical protein